MDTIGGLSFIPFDWRPTMRHRSLLVYFALLSLILIALFATAFSGAPAPPAHGERNAAVLPDLVGTWTGTWRDTIFEVGGAMTFIISENAGIWHADGSIDLTEIGFGQGVMPGTADGASSGDALTFSFAATDVGTGGGSLISQSATGSGVIVAPMSFGNYTFEGTATDAVIWGTFDFPTGGAGKAMLWNTTPTEETSMSAIKAHYE